MLDLGCWVWVAGFRCWIWAAGWGVRPRATRIEGASEQPGSWCRAAMHGCWQGVGGLAHPPLSLLPSPSCCGYPVSGFSTLVKRKQCRRMSALAPSPILQPSTLESLRWWGLQQLARHPGAPTPLLPPPPPHPALRISLTRQQPAGTTGIRGETSKGCSLSRLEHQRVSPGMGCRAVEAERTREHPMGWGQGWGCGAVLLVRSGCWAVGCRAPTALLPHSPQPPQGPGVQRTLRAGQDPGGRAGCWGAGTRPGMREAQREEEGRGGSGGLGEGRPPAHPSCITGNIWPGLRGRAWAAHACAHMHTGMGTHTCTYGFMDVCISVHASTPVYTHARVYTHIHRHGGLHTHAARCSHTRVCI